jgi:hypothetical protein
MVVQAPLFDQESMSYFEYLRRYKRAGREKRLRFPDFCRALHELAEGEFLAAALASQNKKNSAAYRRICRAQKRLRSLLLIDAKSEAPPEQAVDVDEKS